MPLPSFWRAGADFLNKRKLLLPNTTPARLNLSACYFATVTSSRTAIFCVTRTCDFRPPLRHILRRRILGIDKAAPPLHQAVKELSAAFSFDNNNTTYTPQTCLQRPN